MNKNALKNFAIWARNKLINEIRYKAELLGINEKGIAQPLPHSTEDLQVFRIDADRRVRVEGKIPIAQRDALISAIQAKQISYREAFDAVMEETAYVWFNRLIAVRFMEVNHYLPGGIRVLSSENPAKAEPDLVTDPFDSDLKLTDTEREYIYKLQDNNQSDALFQFLLIKQCNQLSSIFPELFEKKNDYTELLLNINFTDTNGIIFHLVHDIPEDDFNIQKEGQVEIIGWLYQCYNTEPKERVFSRPDGQKIRKEDIPAATQLFTPDWIVHYMVENSLGRCYINGLKSGKWKTESEKDIAEKMGWKYYLPEAEQTPDAADQLLNHSTFHFPHSTFLDPCMGSGHILVYAFDVYMDIYTSQGYTERDAVQKIVKDNLFGLDLDDRASQLAGFAIMMKARSYDRRFLTRGIRPNLCSIQESNSISPDSLELFGNLKPIARRLYDSFLNAKAYGSFLTPDISAYEIQLLEEKYTAIVTSCYDDLYDRSRQLNLQSGFHALIRQAKILRRLYDIVCTNPPYMGKKSLNPELGRFLEQHFPEGKSDLYTAFMLRCMAMAADEGMIAMITIHTWMFIRSAAALRKKMLSQCTILSMVHTGAATFEELNAFNVLSTAFVLQKGVLPDYRATYVRLAKFYQPNEKLLHFHDPAVTYTCSSRCFDDLPGAPLVYWISDSVRHCFCCSPALSSFSTPRQGLATADNNRFVRCWSETELSNTMLHCTCAEEAAASGKKWFPYNKGGDFRKWYGMNQYVINYKNNGAELKAFRSAVIRNESMYFRSGITWSLFGFETFSVRYKDSGFIFDVSGSSMFPKKELAYYILAFLASKPAFYFLSLIAPTVNFQVGNIADLPLRIDDSRKETIDKLTEENIQLSKDDWDSFEISWDFKQHPLL